MPVALSAAIVAVVGGLAIGAQSFSAGILGGRIGVMESVFIIHLGGLVLSALILLLMRGGNMATWRSVPWYILIGGLYGVVILAAYSFAIPRIGLATTVTLAIVAQLILSAILDHYGFLGSIQHALDWRRLVGMLVLFAGTWMIVR
ncbi:DMT family transporter [Candidatus Bipolaricaulota bacterium]|nr:DMT family transporter [Candidatus Bipolaricaulota bacterium]